MSEQQAVNGHWSVELERYPRIEDRFPLGDLRERISQARVSLRGWDCPDLEDRLGPAIDRGITCITDWREYQERWVFKQSGYFAHRWRIREDGIPERRWSLDFISTIWSITEVWQFAKRLYGSE